MSTSKDTILPDRDDYYHSWEVAQKLGIPEIDISRMRLRYDLIDDERLFPKRLIDGLVQSWSQILYDKRRADEQLEEVKKELYETKRRLSKTQHLRDKLAEKDSAIYHLRQKLRGCRESTLKPDSINDSRKPPHSVQKDFSSEELSKQLQERVSELEQHNQTLVKDLEILEQIRHLVEKQ